MDHTLKKKEASKITIIGAALDLLLGVGKIIIGGLYHSQALIADGIHSLSDILTDIFVLFISNVSHERPDDKHPYGHARFETLGTVIIGGVLVLVAIFMALDNIEHFLANDTTFIPGTATVVITIFSIFSKEWIYRKTLAVGKRIQSDILIANAWHSRSDAFTSILVLISIILAYLGYEQLDIVMAIVLSVLIGKIGWDFIWKSVKELVDTSLDEKELKEIEEIISSVHGVKGHHNLRSRKMGSQALIDVNIEVDALITVSEGHEIASWVAHEVKKKLPHILDITVHTDIEDDRGDKASYIHHDFKELPLRDKVLQDINDTLSGLEKDLIAKVDLHYIGEYISITIIVKPHPGEDLLVMKEKISKINYIKDIHFQEQLVC